MGIMDQDNGSKIANCLIVPRRSDENLVVENARGDGSVFVNLEGYVIAPREMITDEQMKILFPGASDTDIREMAGEQALRVAH